MTRTYGGLLRTFDHEKAWGNATSRRVFNVWGAVLPCRKQSEEPPISAKRSSLGANNSKSLQEVGTGLALAQTIQKAWNTVEAWAFRPTIKRKKEAGFSP